MKIKNFVSWIIIAIGFLGVGIAVFRGIGADMIINTDALLIVGGGALIAIFISYHPRRIKSTIEDVRSSFKTRNKKELLISDILSLSRIYRKGGIRALEQSLGVIKDEFLKFGISLIVSNYRTDDIRNMLEREAAEKIVRYNCSINVLRTISKLTPSLGLAGTVISLIKMFKHFDTLETLTPFMAVALMSTFYGVIVSNLIVMPLCAKVKEMAISAETLMALSIDGIMAVNVKEHPSKIEEMLSGNDSAEVVVKMNRRAYKQKPAVAA
ncbi:MotA/TolQ/ExbB proton channel [Candidatus Magnetoovum chiemensis]|nr:MotA/TolQ/ExbB proton channel [Candidatus Magnetoovum chiemensis]